MAVYAIGDVQGCYDELNRLLDKLGYDDTTDKLWFAGDLVNRGPKSLKTLRFIKSLGESAKVVLGNHDLHAMAVYYEVATLKPKDTIEKLIIADDSKSLFEWLCQQPLALHSPSLNALMVHAGVPPSWSIKHTLSHAGEIQQALKKSKSRIKLLSNMYGNNPDQWHTELEGIARQRFIINALTRMRFCLPDGRLELNTKTSPDAQNTRLLPWFELHNPAMENTLLVFGHWAALMGATPKANIYALDTGCVWGGKLTALNLETRQRIAVNSRFRAIE